jgi:hypothetical protein
LTVLKNFLFDDDFIKRLRDFYKKVLRQNQNKLSLAWPLADDAGFRLPAFHFCPAAAKGRLRKFV